MNRNHAWMAQPRCGLGLADSPGYQLGAFARGTVRREEDFLYSDVPAEQFVSCPPHAAHTALTDLLRQAIPPANQITWPICHDRNAIEVHMALRRMSHYPLLSDRYLTEK